MTTLRLLSTRALHERSALAGASGKSCGVWVNKTTRYPRNHSWGGDTAAKAAVANPGRVRLLITIDPVSIFNPDFDKVRNSVGTWVNVYAAGNPESSSFETGLQGGLVSGIGGEWSDTPNGYADIFISAPYNHADFTRMMHYHDGNNSAQEILNKLKQ